VKDPALKAKVAKLAKEARAEASNLPAKVFARETLLAAVVIGIGYLVLAALAIALLGDRARSIVIGFPVVFVLAWVAQVIAGNHTIQYYGIEYVLLVPLSSLGVSFIGVPAWLKPRCAPSSTSRPASSML
jgi:hypothetical protein